MCTTLVLFLLCDSNDSKRQSNEEGVYTGRQPPIKLRRNSKTNKPSVLFPQLRFRFNNLQSAVEQAAQFYAHLSFVRDAVGVVWSFRIHHTTDAIRSVSASTNKGGMAIQHQHENSTARHSTAKSKARGSVTWHDILAAVRTKHCKKVPSALRHTYIYS